MGGFSVNNKIETLRSRAAKDIELKIKEAESKFLSQLIETLSQEIYDYILNNGGSIYKKRLFHEDVYAIKIPGYKTIMFLNNGCFWINYYQGKDFSLALANAETLWSKLKRWWFNVQ